DDGSSGLHGDVVEGLGLWSWTLPPPGPESPSGCVGTRYSGVVATLIPNLSLSVALAPSPLSTIRTRKRTCVSPVLVLAKPQMSRELGTESSMRYPVISTLSTWKGVAPLNPPWST